MVVVGSAETLFVGAARASGPRNTLARAKLVPIQEP